MGQALGGQMQAHAPLTVTGGPAGAFQRHAAAWAHLPGVGYRVLGWVREGYDFRPGRTWQGQPEWSEEHAEWNAIDDEEEETWASEELDRWLAAGVCRLVKSEDERVPGVIHPLLVVDKPGWQQLPADQQWVKRYRLCLAVKRDFNDSLQAPHLRMETLERCLSMVTAGDWLAAGDLSQGYNHIALHERARRWARFMFRGRLFEMHVLFFGLSTAPWVFSTTVGRVLAALRAQGIRASGYIDDWMFAAPKDELRALLSRWVWPLTGTLGFCWGSKSDWEIATCKKHLGLLVHSDTQRVSLPEPKVRQLRDEARYFRGRHRVQLRTLLRLIGRLRAYRLAIPNATLLAWELAQLAADVVCKRLPFPQRLDADELRERWRPLLRAWVTLSPGAVRAVTWLGNNVSTQLSRRFDEAGLRWVAVDAGPDRAGGRCKGLPDVSMAWPGELLQAMEGHQSRREAVGAGLVLRAYGKRLAGTRVVLMNDNLGNVSVFNNMRRGALAPWIAEALWACVELGVELHRASWLPGRELVRRGVDALSRVVDVNDWTLVDTVWQRICAWEPKLEVDRFASANNAKLPRWNSRWLELGSEQVDALAQDWRGTVSYACPPVALVLQVVTLLQRQSVEAVIVVPHWPGQLWWPMLCALAPAQEDWLWLGEGQRVFQPGPSGMGAVFRHNWTFWAVRCGRKTSGRCSARP